jgi:hypothetical protein
LRENRHFQIVKIFTVTVSWTRTEISQFLAGVELFRGLEGEELRELAGHILENRCSPGEVIFSENSPREDIFVVYEGEVELFKKNPYGIDVRLALFGRGDFIGEGIWEAGSLHTTSARTVKAATLLDINRDFFQRSPSTTLKILLNITRIISRRMRNANTRLPGYAMHSMRPVTPVLSPIFWVRGRFRAKHITVYRPSVQLKISISQG